MKNFYFAEFYPNTSKWATKWQNFSENLDKYKKFNRLKKFNKASFANLNQRKVKESKFLLRKNSAKVDKMTRYSIIYDRTCHYLPIQWTPLSTRSAAEATFQNKEAEIVSVVNSVGFSARKLKETRTFPFQYSSFRNSLSRKFLSR